MQLGLGESVLDEAAHDLADFGRGGHGSTGTPHRAGTLRCLPGWGDLALVPQPEAAVGKFEDLLPRPVKAGPLLAGQQLQGTPVVLDGVALATLRECLKQRISAGLMSGSAGRYAVSGCSAGTPDRAFKRGINRSSI